MGSTQLYIISVLQGKYDIIQYLFECEKVEYYRQDAQIILDQFFAATKMKPENTNVIDIEEAPFLYYTKSLELK